MQLSHAAVGGTEDSGDVLVEVAPGQGTLELEINSKVLSQYGSSIKKTVLETLTRLNVTDAKVIVKDKGAVDQTIRARLVTAIFRAADMKENLPWGDL
ncbi:Citrate lyase acyl carrier protein [bioreactor metagenome]|jgi:citrate lyase acyl carrier protein|uniref:Citrate lyase acyl carrier protein n=1 Tax=bioreactor metagenome TaxID=1076179 RepID=A0A645BUY8_9ZZZZ|nr:citrate lyase acyl carrier protein [Acidaminococcaceae bacterium]NLU44881.1 citrate lyase acyl carrier protein [Acholeplasmataceae bacterium]